MAAGPAAATGGGPTLLLGPGGTVPPATRSELARLQPRRLVVLGGTSAVAPNVVASLSALTAGTVARVGGPDRYSTAAALSAAAFAPGVPVVYLTTGVGFADAVVAGAAGAAHGGPVLLTPPDGLPAATAAELSRLQPQQVVIVGGIRSVPDGVDAAVKAAVPTATVTRVAGADRYATSAALAAQAFPASHVAAVSVTTGRTFADAVTAGARGEPVLLVGDGVPDAVRAAVDRLDPATIVVVGGPGAVSDATMTELDFRR